MALNTDKYDDKLTDNFQGPLTANRTHVNMQDYAQCTFRPLHPESAFLNHCCLRHNTPSYTFHNH